MQSQYSIELKEVPDSSRGMKDVFLNGGHIGSVGEQVNSKGKPYATPRYWFAKNVVRPDGNWVVMSEGGFLEEKWAVEALIRSHPRMEQFCIQDVTDRLDAKTLALFGDMSNVTMVLGSDGHVSSVVVPKGEMTVAWVLTPKQVV